MSHTISIIPAARCACIAKEVTVFASGALKILSTLTRAIWQTNWGVVVISASESRRTVAVVARIWIHTVWLLTDKSVRRAIELVITRWRRLANTIGTIRASRTISWSGAAVRGATRTISAFTVAILTTGYRVAIAVVDTAAEVVGIKAFVIGIAKPIAGALLIEVAGCRGCTA